MMSYSNSMTAALPSLISDDPTDLDRWHSLSDQEHQILALAAQPMSNKKVAAELDVSERTVERALSKAGRKLGIPKGQGKLPTLKNYRELATRVGKPDVGFSTLGNDEALSKDGKWDVIEIPLAKFDDPGVIRAIEHEMGWSRLEALDHKYGIAFRLGAIAGLAFVIALVGMLVVAFAVLFSQLLG